MESIDPVWLFGGIVLVGGVLIGVLLLRVFNPVAGDVDKLQAELEQARSDMESYKASVNSHFDKTSELVNELTQDYVKVYRHLAEGAQTLSDTREFTQVLDQPQGQVLISVEAQADQTPDPLAVEGDQAPGTVAGDAPGADADTEATASVQDSAAQEAPIAPADYARVSENDTATATTETVSDDSESVAETLKEGQREDQTEDETEDDIKAATVSAEEGKTSESDGASAAEAEQPAADASETDVTKKA